MQMSLCLGTKVPLRPAPCFLKDHLGLTTNTSTFQHWAKFRTNCGTIFFSVKLPPLGLSLLINETACAVWSGLYFAQSDTLQPINEQILHSYGGPVFGLHNMSGNLTPLPQ